MHLLRLVVLLTLAACAGTPAPTLSPARIEQVQVESAVFGNTRTLRVWLPPGYDEQRRRRYPVLYLNDGQSLFDPSTFSEHEWRADETADRMIRAHEIEPIIIVGIDNAGRAGRPREYLPWEDVYLTPREPSPRGTAFPAFFFNEVVPLIEARFRVREGAQSRTLGGASYGGLIAVYTAVNRPGELAGLLIESPSLYVSDAEVLKLAEANPAWPARIYLGIGTHEGPRECLPDNAVAEAVDDVRRLESIVRRTAPGTAIHTVVEQCGLHDERYWARRFPEALRFLYPPS